MCTSSLGPLRNGRFGFSRPEVGLRVCIVRRLPGDTGAAGPGTTDPPLCSELSEEPLGYSFHLGVCFLSCRGAGEVVDFPIRVLEEWGPLWGMW